MPTPERIDAIFTEMGEYVLELLPDPSALGPQYFRDLIAVCRNYLNRVSLVTVELEREKLTLSSELRKLEAAYSLEYDNLLANDHRVKSLNSIDDRKATAGYLLRDQRQAINELKDQLAATESTYKIVLLRSRELNATMMAIKDQKKAMQMEIKSGGFYGDERNIPNGVEKASRASALLEVSAEELASLLSDSEPNVASSDTSDEDLMDQFLSKD